MQVRSTRYTDSSPRFRRPAAVMAIAFHAALIIAAMLMKSDRPHNQISAIVSFDVAAPGPPSPEPPEPDTTKEVPPQPSEPVIVPPVDIRLPTENTISVAMVEQDEAKAAGGGCDLTAPVQAALRANPQVAELMPTIPTERRSVANALAVWNKAWVEADQHFPEEALAEIRGTVRRTVEAASDACKLQEQGGPRLIYLPIENSTTVLALGSGKWTWQEVSDSADPTYLLEESELATLNDGGDSAAPKQNSRKNFIKSLFGSSE